VVAAVEGADASGVVASGVVASGVVASGVVASGVVASERALGVIGGGAAQAKSANASTALMRAEAPVWILVAPARLIWASLYEGCRNTQIANFLDKSQKIARLRSILPTFALVPAMG
jgi:hypothetical protein